MNYNDYLNLLKQHCGHEYLFVTKLEVVGDMEGMAEAEHLTDYQRNNLLCNIACFWIDNDLQENTLFDITWVAVVNELGDLAYAEFCERMEDLI